MPTSQKSIQVIKYYEIVNYYYESVVHSEKLKFGETGINWLLGPITEIMNEKHMSKFVELLPANKLAEFIIALVEERFNKSKAKEAFKEFLVDFDLDKIMQDPKYKILDQNIVDAAINKVIADNPEMVAKAKADPRMVNWIVGQIMKACQGQAKAPEVKAKIDEILSKQ